MEGLAFLPSPPADYSGPQVLSLPAQPWEIPVAPVGRAYEDYLRVVHGLETLELDSCASGADQAEDGDAEKYEGHRKKNALDTLFTENYYDLLGLGHLKWKATQDDLKKAYRQAVLVHHPDKQAQATNTSDDEVFKTLQKGYEILSNPKTRKAYDSQEPFDDSVPDGSELKTDADFYTVFAPVFERNAKWSVDKVTVTLGDENTNINQVNKFYNFWYSMKSWRDFSYLDEYDPEEAESREEKRWMERRNAKERLKREGEEKLRLRNFVDVAYKFDPRIRKMKEAEQKERDEIKQRRLDIINQKKAEEERIKKEAQDKIDAENQKLKDTREAEKNDRARNIRLKKKKRQIIRQFGKKFEVSESIVDYICENLELEVLTELASALNSNPDITQEVVHEVMSNYSKGKREVPTSPVKPKAVEVEEEAVWTQEEIVLLTKAVVKFPGGTTERWEKISQFIGGKKTVKQIIARVRASQHVAAAPASVAKPAATTAAPAKVAPVVDTSVDADDGHGDAGDGGEWTADEQKLLEVALKAYPASLGKDRWTKISEAVPGRTRRDCVERYKYLVSVIQQNK
eukprot:TRINITY_DN15257_c0_g1_i1.p1 TRINITY_DN15257_c0_g1~~TRINITY_DN15257_c0_g1_i1.p1  ORF type:complete len:572 (-),score=174.04 TRINITY_DN15257_c0_g1_i1:108-1823(-)